MKIVFCTLLAVAFAGQPLMLQAADAPVPAKPAAPAKAKVAGTKQAVSSGISAETVEMSLLVGGVVVAIAAGASSGGGGHDCHRCSTGGTTGTTGTN